MSFAKNFGAIGDGKADDTDALQHAVDDGDGVLELSKGTYRITQPIVLDARKHGYLGVRGEQGTARIVMAGVGPALQIVGDTIQATLDAPGANVMILGKAEDPPGGIRLVAITGNVLGSRDRNIVIDHGSRISITGNTIYGGQRLNCEFRNSRFITFGSNSCFSRPASYASETTDGILLDKCVGCSLVGNVLNDCRLGNEEAGGSITVRDSRNIAISASQILNPHFRGIDVTNSSRCNISGNSIHEAEGTGRLLTAIRIRGDGSQNWVQGNSVSAGATGDIQCDDSNARVEGNYISYQRE